MRLIKLKDVQSNLSLCKVQEGNVMHGLNFSNMLKNTLKCFHNEKTLLFSVGAHSIYKELEQMIARTLFLMHKNTFRARYIL